MPMVEVVCHYNYMIDFKSFFLKHKICCLDLFEHITVSMHWSSVGVQNTVVEWETYMQVCTG